jgi:6-phosphogluconolactonase
VLTGPRNVEEYPSQLIRPSNGRLLFLLDEAAAAKLPPATEVFTTPHGTRKVGTLEI